MGRAIDKFWQGCTAPCLRYAYHRRYGTVPKKVFRLCCILTRNILWLLRIFFLHFKLAFESTGASKHNNVDHNLALPFFLPTRVVMAHLITNIDDRFHLVIV